MAAKHKQIYKYHEMWYFIFMNKNFSQGFIKETVPSFASLIIRDLITRKFLILTSNEQAVDESDFTTTLNSSVDLEGDIALQLAKSLYESKIMLNTYRELSRNNTVEFSLIDNTPGYVSSDVCYYVEADIPNVDGTVSPDSGYDASLVTFDELVNMLRVSPVSSYISIVGLSQLKNTVELLS